jgi:hypothetical protein
MLVAPGAVSQEHVYLMNHPHRYAALAALTLLLSPAASLAANRHQTPDELTADADKVILGTVGIKNSRWGSDSRIYTDVVISPEVTIKGADEGAIVVEIAGGEIGDVGMAVSDGPEFAPGERVLIFLKRGNNRYQVVGRETGKYAADSADVETVLEKVFERVEKGAGERMHYKRNIAEQFLRKAEAKTVATGALTTTTTTTTTSTGCYVTDGTKWGVSSTTYKLNATVPPTWAASIDAAAATWNSAGAAFKMTNSTFSTNELSLVDLVAKYGSGYANTYAVATVWYNTTTRLISKAGIEIGTRWQWSTAGQANMADVQNIVTHEFGHWMRLLDIYSPSTCGEATMWGTSPLGETKQRTLDQADINGFISLYGKSSSIGAPVLTYPANGAAAIPTTPTLTWNPGTGAASYEVYFGTTSAPPLVATVAATTYKTATLATGTTYYWRIVAKSSTGMATSATWSFTTSGALPAPVLISPLNGATGQTLTPLLKWNAVAGASSYDLYIGTSASPGFIGTVNTTSVTISGVSAATTYYWKVVAKGTAGSSASPVWSFRTR